MVARHTGAVDRRPAAALLLCLLPLTACAQVQETAGRASDCVSLARDVAAAGVAGTPSIEDAERAVQRLDERIPTLGDDELRAAATTLRDRLRELEVAARAADPAAVSQAAEAAREAARETARSCSLPVEQFLGG